MSAATRSTGVPPGFEVTLGLSLGHSFTLQIAGDRRPQPTKNFLPKLDRKLCRVGQRNQDSRELAVTGDQHDVAALEKLRRPVSEFADSCYAHSGVPSIAQEYTTRYMRSIIVYTNLCGEIG